MDSRKGGLKLALIVFSISLTGLTMVYRQIYPLSISGGKGFLLQIPPVFWVLVVVALGALFFVAILTRSSLVTLGSIVAIALVLNFHHFLIYSVNGRDVRGEVSRLFFTLNQSHLGVDLYSYFQWPTHFLVIQQADRILSLSLMDTIWTGYLAYYVLFAIGIGVFAHAFTEGGSFSWAAGGIFYVIFTRQWLNNQLVPQFFALIILLYLFSIHGSDDTRLRIFRGVLYVVLVLSHPFFFAFYVLYVLALPFTRAVADTLSQVGTTGRPLYHQAFETLRHTPTAVVALQGNLRHRFNIAWMNHVVFLAITYLSFLLIRFTLFKRQLFVLLAGPESKSPSGKVPARVMELLFGRGEDVTETGIEPVLLYDLTPQPLKEFTLYSTIGLLLVILLVAAVALVAKPSTKLTPSGVAVAIGGVVYYVVGFVLPIIGTRAFQVMLLPMGTFLDGRDHGKYVKVLVLVLLVASPVVVANFMTNYSLHGGGETHDLHADQAGRFLVEYSRLERDGAVAYRGSGFPPFISKTGEDLNITTVEGIITADDDAPDVITYNESDVIVYGERQHYQAARFGYQCNFDPEERNVVYDNRVQVLRGSIVSEELACSKSETQPVQQSVRIRDRSEQHDLSTDVR